MLAQCGHTVTTVRLSTYSWAVLCRATSAAGRFGRRLISPHVKRIFLPIVCDVLYDGQSSLISDCLQVKSELKIDEKISNP